MKNIFLAVIVTLNVTSSQVISLQGIQSKIEQAFYAAFSGGNSSELTIVAEQLKQDGSPLATYWYAYAKYYESVFYLKMGEKGKSEKVVNDGVEVLSKLKNKNSDDYALLVIMQNFSMQFADNVMKLGVISEQVGQNVEKAIKADANNLRAYYAAAASDFYTPEQYGGGKQTEGYLLKAITFSEQPVDDSSLPSWGKDQAYQMLVSLYLKKGNMALAKKYLEEAAQLYPRQNGWAELEKQINNLSSGRQ